MQACASRATSPRGAPARRAALRCGGQSPPWQSVQVTLPACARNTPTALLLLQVLVHGAVRARGRQEPLLRGL
jgi:hypothetical protein